MLANLEKNFTIQMYIKEREINKMTMVFSGCAFFFLTEYNLSTTYLL